MCKVARKSTFQIASHWGWEDPLKGDHCIFGCGTVLDYGRKEGSSISTRRGNEEYRGR